MWPVCCRCDGTPYLRMSWPLANLSWNSGMVHCESEHRCAASRLCIRSSQPVFLGVPAVCMVCHSLTVLNLWKNPRRCPHQGNITHVIAQEHGALKGQKVARVTFNEVTKDAVARALQSPRQVRSELPCLACV
jgi:hypothetical protein